MAPRIRKKVTLSGGSHSSGSSGGEWDILCGSKPGESRSSRPSSNRTSIASAPAALVASAVVASPSPQRHSLPSRTSDAPQQAYVRLLPRFKDQVMEDQDELSASATTEVAAGRNALESVLASVARPPGRLERSEAVNSRKIAPPPPLMKSRQPKKEPLREERPATRLPSRPVDLETRKPRMVKVQEPKVESREKRSSSRRTNHHGSPLDLDLEFATKSPQTNIPKPSIERLREEKPKATPSNHHAHFEDIDLEFVINSPRADVPKPNIEREEKPAKQHSNRSAPLIPENHELEIAFKPSLADLPEPKEETISVEEPPTQLPDDSVDEDFLPTHSPHDSLDDDLELANRLQMEFAQHDDQERIRMELEDAALAKQLQSQFNAPPPAEDEDWTNRVQEELGVSEEELELAKQELKRFEEDKAFAEKLQREMELDEENERKKRHQADLEVARKIQNEWRDQNSRVDPPSARHKRPIGNPSEALA